MSSIACRKLWLPMLLTITSLVAANRLCIFGCISPFWPGHKNMGRAWWAIGRKGVPIKHLTATLRVGDAPADLNGLLAINSAMENNDVRDEYDKNLIGRTYQAMTGAWPVYADACGQQSGQWCSFASMYDYKRTVDQQQQLAPPVPKGSGDVELEWEYFLGDAMGEPGVVSLRSGAVSLSSPASEPLWQAWFKTECGCESNGTVPAHTYKNITVTLGKPIPDWGSSASHRDTDLVTEPYTKDGGNTWTIDEVNIQATWCNNEEKCFDPTKGKVNKDSKTLPWTTVTSSTATDTAKMTTFTSDGFAYVTAAAK